MPVSRRNTNSSLLPPSREWESLRSRHSCVNGRCQVDSSCPCWWTGVSTRTFPDGTLHESWSCFSGIVSRMPRRSHALGRRLSSHHVVRQQDARPGPVERRPLTPQDPWPRTRSCQYRRGVFESRAIGWVLGTISAIGSFMRPGLRSSLHLRERRRISASRLSLHRTAADICPTKDVDAIDAS